MQSNQSGSQNHDNKGSAQSGQGSSQGVGHQTEQGGKSGMPHHPGNTDKQATNPAHPGGVKEPTPVEKRPERDIEGVKSGSSPSNVTSPIHGVDKDTGGNVNTGKIGTQKESKI